MNTATLDTIKPLVCSSFNAPEGISFSTACFEGDDWSLAPLSWAGDQDKAPGLAVRVGQALHGLGARYAYAPYPAEFNGKIIMPDLLSQEIPLWNVMMYRNKLEPADGTWLSSPSSAGVFSAGGCSMIVAALGKEVIFAHAGRECVIDRKRIMSYGHKRGRRRESVVDSIVSAMAPTKYLRKRMRAWVFYSIKPEHFLHSKTDADPDHLKYNIRAAELLPPEYGDACGWVEDGKGIYINIPTIIKKQFVWRGIPEENINLEHAYLSDELPTTRNGGGRYLTAVVRHT